MPSPYPKKRRPAVKPAFPESHHKRSGIATAAGQETQSAEAQKAHRRGLRNRSQLIDGHASGTRIPVDGADASGAGELEQGVEAATTEARIIQVMQDCELR